MAIAFNPVGTIPAALLPFSDDFGIDEAAFRSHLRDLAATLGVVVEIRQ